MNPDQQGQYDGGAADKKHKVAIDVYKRQVYTLLTSTTGLIIGKVIFQKFSQPVAPSMEEASYKEGEMPCRPAKNMRIWTPDDMVIV